MLETHCSKQTGQCSVTNHLSPDVFLFTRSRDDDGCEEINLNDSNSFDYDLADVAGYNCNKFL